MCFHIYLNKVFIYIFCRIFYFFENRFIYIFCLTSSSWQKYNKTIQLSPSLFEVVFHTKISNFHSIIIMSWFSIFRHCKKLQKLINSSDYTKLLYLGWNFMSILNISMHNWHFYVEIYLHNHLSPNTPSKYNSVSCDSSSARP